MGLPCSAFMIFIVVLHWAWTSQAITNRVGNASLELPNRFCRLGWLFMHDKNTYILAKKASDIMGSAKDLEILWG